MTDVSGLGGLGVTALTEGIKFLYQQADELLQRRRARKAPPIVKEPRVLPSPDPDRVTRFETDLSELAKALREQPSLEAAEALRGVLGAVYGVPIVFSGEVVRGSIDVDEVAGYAAAVRADIASGRIEGIMRVGRVEAGGEAIGVDLRSWD